MKAKKISTSEISELKIASLPTRPTAPKSMGGKGYGAQEMKEAFDKLPLFIIERFNALIDDVSSTGEDSLANAIKTNIRDSHTLSDLFKDIASGELISYLFINGESLECIIAEIKSELAEIKATLDSIYGGA